MQPTQQQPQRFTFLPFLYKMLVIYLAAFPIFHRNDELRSLVDPLSTVWNPLLPATAAFCVALVGSTLLVASLFIHWRRAILSLAGFALILFAYGWHERINLLLSCGIAVVFAGIVYITRFEWGRNTNYYKADLDMYGVMWRQITGSGKKKSSSDKSIKDQR